MADHRIHLPIDKELKRRVDRWRIKKFEESGQIPALVEAMRQLLQQALDAEGL